MNPGSNRVYDSCTRVQMKKCTRVQRVHLISTALEPIWKFISFSHDRSASGERQIVALVVSGSSPLTQPMGEYPSSAKGGRL